jgi:hypothetical protein
MNIIIDKAKQLFFDFKTQISNVSSSTLEWLAYVILHASTVPSMIALMTSMTDKVPPVDVVLIVWLALSLFFVRAVVQKNMLNVITIGLGFVLQAVFLILIFF